MLAVRKLEDTGESSVLHADRLAPSRRIDLLVNVAGRMDNFASADAVADELWDAVLAVNLTVPVRMMRGVLPFMMEKKAGVIVNVSSTAGVSGAVAGIAYTSSKHGLVRLISLSLSVPFLRECSHRTQWPQC